jgi:hypothetical protein
MEGLQPDEDVQLVIDLELRLLQRQARASAEELDTLLHPDFVEFGASGRKWDRSQRTTSLTGGQLPGGQAAITASEITGARLADDVVHVTYVSLRDRRRARRSSIWRRTDAGWRIYFHQGTLTQIG